VHELRVVQPSWQSSAVARYLGFLCCFKFGLCTRLYRCVCARERSRSFVIVICTICSVISVGVVVPVLPSGLSGCLNERTLLSRRWRHHFPLKCWYLSIRQYCITSNKTVMFVFIAVRTSDQHSFKAIASLPFVVCSDLRSARACVCACIFWYNALHSNRFLSIINTSSLRVFRHLLLKIR